MPSKVFFHRVRVLDSTSTLKGKIHLMHQMQFAKRNKLYAQRRGISVIFLPADADADADADDDDGGHEVIR